MSLFYTFLLRKYLHLTLPILFTHLRHSLCFGKETSYRLQYQSSLLRSLPCYQRNSQFRSSPSTYPSHSSSSVCPGPRLTSSGRIWSTLTRHCAKFTGRSQIHWMYVFLSHLIISITILSNLARAIRCTARLFKTSGAEKIVGCSHRYSNLIGSVLLLKQVKRKCKQLRQVKQITWTTPQFLILYIQQWKF